MTLDKKKTKSTTKKRAEAAAKRVTEANGFPPWKCIAIESARMTPGLCIVVGEVL